MLTTPEIRLAHPKEASVIAEMSREYIEYGLGWSWTCPRVLGAIRSKSANVAVAHDAANLVGFGIMSYAEEKAHLQLLCTHRLHRRRGIGSQVVRWLEQCAGLCVIRWLQVEARADNLAALTFYQKLGFDPVNRLSGYYRCKEDAILFVKDCWLNAPAENYSLPFNNTN